MNEAGNPISNLKVVPAPVDARAEFNDRSSEVDAYDGSNGGHVFDCLPYRDTISNVTRKIITKSSPQSVGFWAKVATLMRISPSPGTGMGTSLISRRPPSTTIAAFIFDLFC
jgi:hypothetical protein